MQEKEAAVLEKDRQLAELQRQLAELRAGGAGTGTGAGVPAPYSPSVPLMRPGACIVRHAALSGAARTRFPLASIPRSAVGV